MTDSAPNIVADLFLFLLARHDRRTLGHICPATLWIAALLVPIHLISPFLTTTDWWRNLAPVLLALM